MPRERCRHLSRHRPITRNPHRAEWEVLDTKNGEYQQDWDWFRPTNAIDTMRRISRNAVFYLIWIPRLAIAVQQEAQLE
jgi:hypothetical protein